MKKFLAILSLVCFVAFASHAQTPQPTAPAAKKEVSVAKSDESTATLHAVPKQTKLVAKIIQQQKIAHLNKKQNVLKPELKRK